VRVSVVGNSGSGKSTLARALAAGLGVPYLELDSIYHQPDWVALPVDEFQARVTAFTAGEGWVIDGNYSAVRPIVWARADAVIWLDLPRRVVMRQLLARTLPRAVLRRELWNGNRETVGNLFRRTDDNILRWAWTNHEKYRARYAAAAADPQYTRLRFVRLTARRPDVRAVLDALAEAG
jgi:adenylate kinase family enzyme